MADGIIFPLSKMLLGTSPEQQFGSLRCLKLVAMKGSHPPGHGSKHGRPTSAAKLSNRVQRSIKSTLRGS